MAVPAQTPQVSRRSPSRLRRHIRKEPKRASCRQKARAWTRICSASVAGWSAVDQGGGTSELGFWFSSFLHFFPA